MGDSKPKENTQQENVQQENAPRETTLLMYIAEFLCKKPVADFYITLWKKIRETYRTCVPSKQAEFLPAMICKKLIRFIYSENVASGASEIDKGEANRIFNNQEKAKVGIRQKVEEYVSKDGVGIGLFDDEEKHVRDFIARSEVMVRLMNNGRNEVLVEKKIVDERYEKDIWDSEDGFDIDDDGYKALCDRILSAIKNIPKDKLGWLSEYVGKVTSAADTIKLLSALIIVSFSKTADDEDSPVTIYAKEYLSHLNPPREKEPDPPPPTAPAEKGTSRPETPEPAVPETYITHRGQFFSEILIGEIKELAKAESPGALDFIYGLLKKHAETELCKMQGDVNDPQNLLRIPEFVDFAKAIDEEFYGLIIQHGYHNIQNDSLRDAKLAAFSSLSAGIYVLGIQWVLSFLHAPALTDEILKEEDLTSIRQEDRLRNELEEAKRLSNQRYDQYESALNHVNNTVHHTIVKE